VTNIKGTERKLSPAYVANRDLRTLIRILGIKPIQLLELIGNGTLSRALWPFVPDHLRKNATLLNAFESSVRTAVFLLRADQPALCIGIPEVDSGKNRPIDPCLSEGERRAIQEVLVDNSKRSGKAPPKQAREDIDASGSWSNAVRELEG
jgi:hypothetical protein